MKLTTYENLKHIVAQIFKEYKIASQTRAIGRPRKISNQLAVTLALYKQQSTRATKKSVYLDLQDQLQCSYKTMVVAMNRAASLVLRILLILMSWGRRNCSYVKYTDATDLPVCLKKNMDKHRTMQGLATLGKSSKGWFYGLKLTMTRDQEGRLLGLVFTPANTDDRKIFRCVNKDIYGLIIADAGYVSYELERDMHIEGQRRIMIQPFKSMKKLATFAELKLYRGRFQIEFDFRNLKLFHGLVTSLPRSVDGYLANYLHALLSFVLSKSSIGQLQLNK